MSHISNDVVIGWSCLFLVMGSSDAWCQSTFYAVSEEWKSVYIVLFSGELGRSSIKELGTFH